MKFIHAALGVIASLTLVSTASAQLTANVTVGPNPAPVGCDISFTVSHDAPGFISMQSCDYRILGPADEVVYDPSCGGAIIGIGPYGWLTFNWNQRDQNDVQVPPGVYRIKLLYDFKEPTYHPVVIDDTVDTGIVFEGTATTGDNITGSNRNFYLCAPGEGGYYYWLSGAFTADVGIPTCGGTLPLDNDLLFSLSAYPNRIFKKSLGLLNEQGVSRAPKFPIPNDPTLVGIKLFTAFMVLDPSDPVCSVRKISSTLEMTII